MVMGGVDSRQISGDKGECGVTSYEDELIKDVTVFLLDDHELVPRGLRELLEADGGIIVGELH
jgi:hypothetical protein